MNHSADDHDRMLKEEPGVDQKWEYAKFYILNAAIVVVSLIVSVSFLDFSLSVWMRNFMGLAFLVYALFQLAGYRSFVAAFRGYDLIAKRFAGYGYAYPFIEIAWAVMYFIDAVPLLRDISVVALMTIGIIGIRMSLRKSSKSMVNCACLGTLIKLPLSKITVYEDVTMGVMAAAMIVINI